MKETNKIKMDAEEIKRQKAKGKRQKVGTSLFSISAFKRIGATEVLHFCLLPFAFCLFICPPTQAQLLKKSDYGVGVTIAVYQFDETRSKQFGLTTKLKQTVSTPEDEIDYISRTYGVEELKLRFLRPSVGLKEGEAFTETQTVHEKPLVITVTPRLVTREDVSFDLSIKYAGKPLMEFVSISANNYETVMLRGEKSGFGIREFKGPEGVESVPQPRSILVTVTPAIIVAKGLQNKPSDISRPTDAYGSRVTLEASDTFEMPVILSRAPLKFPPSSQPKGSITLEVVVTPEGRVTNVRVLDSPDSAYNPKAIEAMRNYKFTPAKLNGRPTYATWRETFVMGKEKPL